jgi:hypothetical protein
MGTVLLGFAFLASWAYAQDDPRETYKPCLQATQHLQVPEQIHLAGPGVLPPERPLRLSFLFSEQGTDVYRLYPGSTLDALFVFQDETSRRQELGYLIDESRELLPGSIGGVKWCCFQTGLGRQNWEPIVNFKYATFEFSWLNLATGPGGHLQPEAMIVGATFYAPSECYAHQEFPNTLFSSEIGAFLNPSPSTSLPHDSLAYRVAVALRKKVVSLGSLQASKTEPQSGELGRRPKQTLFPPETAVGGGSFVPNILQVEKPDPIVLQVTATERAWVILEADGNTTGRRVMNPGEVQILRARWYFDVTTGNAGAFILTLNGEALKPMGRHNELKGVHLTRADLKNSTATPAPRQPAVPSDLKLASIRKAAEQGDANAQKNLGVMYYNGQGVPQDYAQAVVWSRKAAEQGDADAENNLAASYQKGQGVPQDYAQAVYWYSKAAEQGSALAQNSLGALYYRGQGVPQDYPQAASWFRKAAEQGNANAQYTLGELYYIGEGVTQDYAESYFWLGVAPSGKVEGVRQEGIDKLRDGAASRLTPAELSQVQERVRKWFEEHPTRVE